MNEYFHSLKAKYFPKTVVFSKCYYLLGTISSRFGALVSIYSNKTRCVSSVLDNKKESHRVYRTAEE